MLIEIISLGLLALFFGIILSIISKTLKKKGEDESYREVEKILPGLNCGACGFANCTEFAKAVTKDNSLFRNCRPGGKEVSDQLAELFSLIPKGKEKKKVARILCNRTDKLEKNFDYQGIESCKGTLLLGYPYRCRSACLGMGDCLDVCQFNAISIRPGDVVPEIDQRRCTGCGACVDACPIGIIEFYSSDERIHVKCACTDHLPDKAKNCDNGCVNCRICVKNCPKGAIKMANQKPVIDHKKCILCNICTEKCPRNVMKKS
jgi:RnfABCDGE-type electron transport complex B subunit